MKMKRTSMIFLLIVLVTVGCQTKGNEQAPEEKNESLENQEESMKNGEKPFEDLAAEDIKEVKMSTSTEEVTFTEQEIEEFVKLLNQIVIYEEIEPEPISGGGAIFEIKYLDGRILRFDNNGNVYIGINEVWYDIEKEPIYELSEFTNRILGITY